MVVVNSLCKAYLYQFVTICTWDPVPNRVVILNMAPYFDMVAASGLNST